ncbi:ANR family transcriptional regulator [Xenorhabdus griffiniae]|uniref:ANR family transcriptional regulator n=1 Tax=Xenorhabdus griffiniae TaxID=351672 RepID=UPI0023582A2A|nr:ANR family transcriptional regulator [Xenorhabdus griffiniae]MDC9606387.1 ANR family transcriptional regulator [Xenorhabdus griffiniae]
MTKKTYLYFADTAIQMEKEEKYDLAAEYWGKARYLATNLKNQLWAEYRQENNEKRHSLHHSHSAALRSQKENRRMAAALKRHMKKQVVNNDCI